MMTSAEITRWLPWAIVAAPLLHICEEFVFPGGFPRWYQAYRGPDVKSITPRFLVAINAFMIFGCVEAARSVGQPIGTAFWLGMAALLASNAVWHIHAALRSRTYSPGIVTGTLLYLPLALFGAVHFLRTGAIPAVWAALAMLLGATFPYWSAWYHNKRRAKPAPLPVP